MGIDAIPGAIIDLYSHDTVKGGGDAAALIGEGDDVKQLLPTVHWYDDLRCLCLQGTLPEKGVCPLLVARLGLQLGVVAWLEVINAPAQ